MRTVTVNASHQYDVVIAPGIMKEAGARIKNLGRLSKVAIVTDDNVKPFYEGEVQSSLEKAGLESVTFTMKAGEESKCADNFIRLLNFLADHKLSRTDAVVALGGGVVGDLAGFAASCYLRGIRFIQIPTTLLAAVDSSVGGKTAIDLSAGKNLAGTFYQPSLVLCDTEAFSTLPNEVFSDGCAEVIKYGAICDKELFQTLKDEDIKENIEAVVARCVEIKSEIVAEDEFDTGKRQLLNFGHTIGHAIEANSNYRISHGSAVAIGMAVITRCAADMGICSKRCIEEIEAVLKKYGLPVKTHFSASALAQKAKSDKKIASASINLVLPRDIGDCFLYNTSLNEIEGIFGRGLK